MLCAIDKNALHLDCRREPYQRVQGADQDGG